MQKLHKRLTLTSVLTERKAVRMRYLAMLATAIFNHVFIKSNISATDRLFVVKFHINIANRWLFMTQIKIMVILLCS